MFELGFVDGDFIGLSAFGIILTLRYTPLCAIITLGSLAITLKRQREKILENLGKQSNLSLAFPTTLACDICDGSPPPWMV